MRDKYIQKVKTVEGNVYQGCVFSDEYINKIKDAMKSGEYEKVAKLMDERSKLEGTFHPLYPFYTISTTVIDGKTIPVSQPLSDIALIKYPPKIKGKFKIEDELKGRSLDELFDYSYRTQTPININMIEMKKMLGEHKDPFQEDVKNLISKKWMIRPEEFPPAKPYKMIVENSSESIDYILLRTLKIDDENRIFISNREQKECIFNIELICDMSNKNFDIIFKVKNYKDKSAKLKELKLIKAFSGGKVKIISLDDGSSLVSGRIVSLENENIKILDNVISFFENILLIEEIFKTVFDIPNNIDESDINTINYLATGIRDGKVIREWKDYSFSITIIKEYINILHSIVDEKPSIIALSGPFKIELFGKTIKIPITRRFPSVKLDDYDKFKKELKVLKIDDSLKINIVPAEDSTFEDIFELDKIDEIKA